MIFDWFKKLFSPKTVVPQLWVVMQEMDPLLSYDRFQALRLSERQRPLVQGLIDGSLNPARIDVVREWCEQNGEEEDGIHSRVFAIQHVLESPSVTYVFRDQELFPVARFPLFVDESTPAVLFSDLDHHLQIASLEEFLSSNQIGAHTLESLDPNQLRDRMTGRAAGTDAPSDQTQPARDTERRRRVSIERLADSDDRVHDPVGPAEIASALNETGLNITADDVSQESPLEKLGLYKVPVRINSELESTVYVWIVSSVEAE